MSSEIRLRDVQPDDLPIFFEQQLDADATRMAGFPARAAAQPSTRIGRTTSSATRRQLRRRSSSTAKWRATSGAGHRMASASSATGSARSTGARVSLPGRSPLSADRDRASPPRSRGQAQRWLDPRPGEVWLHPRTRRGDRGLRRGERRSRAVAALERRTAGSDLRDVTPPDSPLQPTAAAPCSA